MGSNCTRDRDFHHIGERPHAKEAQADPPRQRKAKLSDFIIPSSPSLKLMSVPQRNGNRHHGPHPTRIVSTVGRQLTIRQCTGAVPAPRVRPPARRMSSPSASTWQSSDADITSLSNRPGDDAFPSMTSGSIAANGIVSNDHPSCQRNTPHLVPRSSR